MERELLGKMIMKELQGIKEELSAMVNENKQYKVEVLLGYEFKTIQGRISDLITIAVYYDDEYEIETDFIFNTNSLSMIYIKEIGTIIRELTDKILPLEEYQDEFNRLYMKNSGLYGLSLISAN